MTTYIVTGKIRYSRATGHIQGAIPARAVDKLIASRKTSAKVKAAWQKKINAPIQSTKLICAIRKGRMCEFYKFDNGNKLLKIEKLKR